MTNKDEEKTASAVSSRRAFLATSGGAAFAFTVVRLVENTT